MEVFQIVFYKCTIVTNAIEDFKKSGVFPWDPTAIKNKKFAPSTMYEKQGALLNMNTSINKVGLETHQKPQEDDKTLNVTKVVAKIHFAHGKQPKMKEPTGMATTI